MPEPEPAAPVEEEPAAKAEPEPVAKPEAEPAADKVDPSAEEDLNLPGFKTTENDSSQQVSATPEDEPKESSQSENFSKIAQIPIEHFGLPLKVRNGLTSQKFLKVS